MFVTLPVNEVCTFNVMSYVGLDHVLGGPALSYLFIPIAFSEGNSANFGDI